MSVAELRLWSLRGDWGERKRAMLDRFIDSFSVCFCHMGLCQMWAEVREEAYRQGKPIDVADAWIAATARYLRFPLVSHNKPHFERIPNLRILSPR